MRLQVDRLIGGELKGEVGWKTQQVSANLFVQSPGCHLIQLRQVGVEHDLLASN
jgi:hypothetical protein